MRSTGTWVILASLAVMLAIATAHPNCGCNSGPDQPSAISCGAKVVTYGEPCFCKESLPYSVQVPQSVPIRTERLGSYGYSVVTPASSSAARRLQLPVKIQTPIPETPSCDSLRGKSYGVSVQHQAHRSGPRSYSFDCAIQKPVAVQRAVYRPSLDISFQHVAERVNHRFSPLPIAVQTPYENKIPDRRLTGLSTKVDRVLVPACEINGCPDCNEIREQRPAYTLCH